MFKFKFINLQFFADAGTLTNVTATGTANSYAVNSYTGSDYAADSASKLDPMLKDFYDTELLENARIDMYYAQFGKKQALPAGHKGTVEWRKWNTFARATKLTEGVIPTGQRFGATKLTGSIDQYGTYVSISDKLQLRAYDDVILGATEEMGASAAETQEALIRDALSVGTNVMYCDNVDSSYKKKGDTPTKVGDMHFDSTNGYAMLTPTMVNKAATKMKKAKVPTINGKYIAVIHPSNTFDLRQSPEWVDVHKYAAPEEIFNGEIGELHGVRFIEDTFAPVFNGTDLASDSRTLLTTTGYSTATSTIAFDGGTVAASALIGRKIMINGITATVTANTASSITLSESVNFGTVADNTVIYPGEGAGEGLACYATYFFGKDSFGIIDPEGGALEMIVHDKDEIGGPLNQFSTIGYKFETNGATILYQERLLRVMSTSSYSSTDEAN